MGNDGPPARPQSAPAAAGAPAAPGEREAAAGQATTTAIPAMSGTSLPDPPPEVCGGALAAGAGEGLAAGAAAVVDVGRRVTPALRATALTADSAAPASPSPPAGMRVAASARYAPPVECLGQETPKPLGITTTSLCR